MELFEKKYNKYTKVDNKGILRSYVDFVCRDCKQDSTQRIDEYKRKGDLCRKCKRRIQSINEFNSKDIELVCAKSLLSRLYKRYLHKGLTSNLNGEEALKLFKDNCHYCGIKNSNKYIYKQPHFTHIFFYNGIDRVDSSKGYIKGNILTCCKRCNIAKSDMKYNEFIELIKRIHANLSL